MGNRPRTRPWSGLKAWDRRFPMVHTTCKQTLKDQSECCSGVIFSIFNETNVEYSIASIGDNWGFMNWRSGDNTINRILPLQWALNSIIASTFSGIFIHTSIMGTTGSLANGCC